MQGRRLMCLAGVGLVAGAALAQGSGPWRVVSDPKFRTTVAIDTTRIVRLPHGRVDLWEQFLLRPPRHDRDALVGSIVLHIVADCPALQTALRSSARYTPQGKLISQTATFSVRDDDFTDETAGSVEASALQGLCTMLNHPH